MGTAFATPLRIFGEDGNFQAFEAQPILFTAPGSGASAVLSANSVLTDSNGFANVIATANSIPGTYVVTARYGVLTASFTLTNSGTPASLTPSGSGQAATPGTSSPYPCR